MIPIPRTTMRTNHTFKTTLPVFVCYHGKQRWSSRDYFLHSTWKWLYFLRREQQVNRNKNIAVWDDTELDFGVLILTHVGDLWFCVYWPTDRQLGFNPARCLVLFPQLLEWEQDLAHRQWELMMVWAECLVELCPWWDTVTGTLVSHECLLLAGCGAAIVFFLLEPAVGCQLC